jgi:hypothetical protein
MCVCAAKNVSCSAGRRTAWPVLLLCTLRKVCFRAVHTRACTREVCKAATIEGRLLSCPSVCAAPPWPRARNPHVVAASRLCLGSRFLCLITARRVQLLPVAWVVINLHTIPVPTLHAPQLPALCSLCLPSQMPLVTRQYPAECQLMLARSHS